MRVGGPLDDRDVVATAIADVPGVQAEVDELAVGAVEEAVHVLLGIDVAVGVRMVLRTDAVLLVHRLAEFVHPRGLLLPLRGRQVPVLQHRTGGGVTPHLRDDDDVLAAHGCRQLGDVLDLLPHGVPRVVPATSTDAGARKPFPPRASGCGRRVRRTAAWGRSADSRRDPARSTRSRMRRPRRGSGCTGSGSGRRETRRPRSLGPIRPESARLLLTCVLPFSCLRYSVGRTKGRWIFFQSA